MNRFHFTAHAVERYQERHAPDLAFEEARAFLESRSDDATLLRKKTLRGHALWQLADPFVVLVTKRDAGAEVVVTVLPDADTEPNDLGVDVEEVVAAYQRITPTKPIPVPRSSEALGPTGAVIVIEPRKPAAPSEPRISGVRKELIEARDANVRLRGENAALTIELHNAKQKIASYERKEAARATAERERLASRDRMRAHADRMEAERKQFSKLLKVAIRALVANSDDPIAALALAEIGSAQPGLLNPAFWDTPAPSSIKS